MVSIRRPVFKNESIFLAISLAYGSSELSMKSCSNCVLFNSCNFCDAGIPFSGFNLRSNGPSFLCFLFVEYK